MTETCFGGDFPNAAEQDCNTSAYADLDSCTASKRRRADAIAAQAAAAAGADIYITSRPYLFSVGWEIAYGLLCAKPEGALPLVSLYLRTQGEFIDWRSLDGHGTTSMNRGLFYARSVISLVPRLFGALVGLAERAQASDDRRTIGLAQAMFGRLQQTLVARDEMYRALNRPQNSDVAFEALTAFDLAVLTLMGAVDASARLVHRLLDLAGKNRSARWQWADWRKLVAEKCPVAAAAVEAENRLDVLTVLTELRNTIHAVPLDPLAVVKGRVWRVESRLGNNWGTVSSGLAACAPPCSTCLSASAACGSLTGTHTARCKWPSRQSPSTHCTSQAGVSRSKPNIPSDSASRSPAATTNSRARWTSSLALSRRATLA